VVLLDPVLNSFLIWPPTRKFHARETVS